MMKLVIMLAVMLVIIITVKSFRIRKKIVKNFGLRRSALVYSHSYDKLKNTFFPFRKSAYSMLGDPSLFTPLVYIEPTNKTEINVVLKLNGSARVWFQPDTVLDDLHIVLDNQKNNRFRLPNLFFHKMPKQRIVLNQEFENSFRMYTNPRKQILALQIISPNIMALLIDKAKNEDIEIIDNQIAIISRVGGKSVDNFQQLLYLAINLSKLVRASTKVTKQ